MLENQLNKIIAKSGKSYSKISLATGISIMNISNWAAGKYKPSLEGFVKIAEFLGYDGGVFAKGRLIPKENKQNCYSCLFSRGEGYRIKCLINKCDVFTPLTYKCDKYK